MNRYQNPAIFEPLAFSYAMGTLQGPARRRFEKLMEQHFFLRAVTQAYQQQLSHLDEFLPEITPSAAVWEGISQHLNLNTKTLIANDKKTNGFNEQPWKHWLPWAISSVSFLITAVLLSLLLVQDKLPLNEPKVYLSTMQSPTVQEQLATATVRRDLMQIDFILPSSRLEQPPNKVVALWCTHKDQNIAPIRMGVLQAQTAQTYTLPLSEFMWEEMDAIQDFMIVLEPTEALTTPKSSQPIGELIFKGKLVSL